MMLPRPSFMDRIHTLIAAAKANRPATIVVALLIVFTVWHFAGSPSAAAARYVVATAEKGTLITSITGSGQVAASEQIDVKAKASGDITSVAVKAGQKVVKGQVLAYVDSTDAQKALRDAQINLQSAQIALQKLQQDQSAGSVTATEDLDQAYRDALNKVSNTFLDLPTLIDLTRGILEDSTMHGLCTPNSCQYKNLVSEDFAMEFTSIVYRAEQDYAAAQAAYDPNFADYRALRLDATPDQITTILGTTAHTAELMAQAVKSEQNMLDALTNNLKTQAAKSNITAQIPAQITTYQNSIASAVSNLNGITSDLNNASRTITTSQRAIANDVLVNPTDIATAQNTVTQRQAAVVDAKISLGNCAVRSPFNGIVTKVNVKLGDSLSSGGTIATVITNQTIATLSLNEVDAAKIALADKATLTFDAVPDLTIAGQVLDVDALGTVTQGVVTYNTTLGFVTQDARIKPGMTVSAAIITDSKTDVLIVPSSAVKTQGGQSYVQVIDGTLPATATTLQGFIPTVAPRQVPVTIGASNDTQTEITAGLDEGASVITRTITTSSTTTSAPSILNAAGARSGAGNTFRATGGGAVGR